MKRTLHAKIHRRRGTAMVMGIVLSVIITGMVVSLAWVSGVQTQVTSSAVRKQGVFYAAEAGAQRAYWQFKHNQSYRADANTPLTGTLTVGNAVYRYSVTCTGPGTTVDIESTASLVSVNGIAMTDGAVGTTVGMSASSAKYVPALAVANSLNKKDHIRNLTVNGDLNVQLDLTGDTKHLQVNGNITYGGKVSDKLTNYTGALRKASNTPPPIDYTNLKTRSSNGPNGKGQKAIANMVIDFTALPGPNPVFYANGVDLKDPIFIGSGTLISDHKVIFDKNGDLTIGDADNPVFIVTDNDNVEFHNTHDTITLYGGLYVGNDFKVDSDINIFGPVVVKHNINFKGKKTDGVITAGPKGWFDPRVPPGAQVITTGNFHGVSP